MGGWGTYGFSIGAYDEANTRTEKLHAISRNLRSTAYGLDESLATGWSDHDVAQLHDLAQHIHAAASAAEPSLIAVELDDETMRSLHLATVGAVQALYLGVEERHVENSIFVARRVVEAYDAIQNRAPHRAIAMLRSVTEQEKA
jgi:hypothetical protein